MQGCTLPESFVRAVHAYGLCVCVPAAVALRPPWVQCEEQACSTVWGAQDSQWVSQVMLTGCSSAKLGGQLRWAQ